MPLNSRFEGQIKQAPPHFIRPLRLTPGRTPSFGGYGRTCHVIWDVVIFSRQAWHRLTLVPSKAVPWWRWRRYTLHSTTQHATLPASTARRRASTSGPQRSQRWRRPGRMRHRMTQQPTAAEYLRSQPVVKATVNVLGSENSKINTIWLHVRIEEAWCFARLHFWHYPTCSIS
jgi:hypothetical protein